MDDVRKSKCIICLNESFFIKSVNSFNIFKCSICGIEYTHPMPNKGELQDFYSNYFDIRSDCEVSTRNARRNLEFIRGKIEHLHCNTSILDYGCGKNKFIDICRQEGLLNSYGYDRYVDFNTHDFRITNEYQDKKWDVITIWGVLEHIASPVTQLSSLRDIFSEGGVIVLTTVHIEGFIPYQHKPPEHTLYFTKDSLYKICQLAGLAVIGYYDYYMEQKSDIYLSILHRTMPDKYKRLVKNNMPEFVEIPTNEVFLILEKNQKL